MPTADLLIAPNLKIKQKNLKRFIKFIDLLQIQDVLSFLQQFFVNNEY
jgi:hypothetical protein